MSPFSNILLLGSTGLLGQSFVRFFEENNIPFQAPKRNELDLFNQTDLETYTQTNSFDLIINCVAYTAVDKAETDLDNAQKLNRDLLQNLAKLNLPILNFGTDYVFSVTDFLPIPEDHLTAPLNAYGQTKREGEMVLESSQNAWWNVRTSWLFGSGKNNFLTTMKRLSQEQKTITIVSDQVGRPTFTDDLVEWVWDYVLTAPSGHYHGQNSGDPVSWADWAEYFLKTLNHWNGNINKISSEEYPTPAKRPLNSVLSNTKIEKQLPDWKDATERFNKVQ